MKNNLKAALSFIIVILMMPVFSVSAFANGFESAFEGVEGITVVDSIATMIKENGGILFTTLLIGIIIGAGGTLLVQHIRRKKKQ